MEVAQSNKNDLFQDSLTTMWVDPPPCPSCQSFKFSWAKSSNFFNMKNGLESTNFQFKNSKLIFFCVSSLLKSVKNYGVAWI